MKSGQSLWLAADLALALLGPYFCAVKSLPVAQAAPATAAVAAPLDSRSLFQLSAVWHDQNGQTTTLAALAGSPVVLTFIYTNCKAVCPLTVTRMQQLEAALPRATGQRVRFVLVSLDPGHDTPARLKQFAQAHHLDPQHWLLLSGDDDAVRDLTAVLDVHYRPLAGDQFAHDPTVYILDAAGIPQTQVVDLDTKRASLVALLKRLVSVKH